MADCWAKNLGDCSSKISREHIVSAALWDGPAIVVEGFPWCDGEKKKIGLGSLTAKILCKKHNSDLSEVDSAGADAFRTLQRAVNLQEKRRKERPRKWKVVRFEIDGLRLERWFLKTLINVAVTSPSPGTWADSDTSLKEPPRRFVEAAFGVSPLASPLGLYGAGTVGEEIVMSDSVGLYTLLDGEGGLVGGLFTFLGYRFFLNLRSGEVPNHFPLPSDAGFRETSVLYHIEKLRCVIGKKLSNYVHFLWHLK